MHQHGKSETDISNERNRVLMRLRGERFAIDAQARSLARALLEADQKRQSNVKGATGK